MLALEVNRTVAVDRLIDGLWGERVPPSAHKVVQLYVSRLRKLLAGDQAEILTRGRGYELRLPADRVDAARFERLVRMAERANGAGNGEAREALALWRGAALGDLVDEPFADAEIRRLDALRMRAAELAVDADLDAGRNGEAIAELDTLIVQEPLRERLHAQRMLALYRAGRQGEALEAYRRARSILVEAIGVEPGPELRRLHEAILRQDPALELQRAAAAGLPAALDPDPPLAGRGVEIGRLRDHWRRSRDGRGALVVVQGPDGIGKTRLAAELAGEVFRAGDSVLYAAADAPPQAARTALADARSARRPTLLVVDDVERAGDGLREALAEVVDALAAHPVMALVIGERCPPEIRLRADDALELAPLDADGVRAVARLYAREPAEVEHAVERLARASGGIPQRLHRAAHEWAHESATRRLDAAAARAASERAAWHAAEDDLAGTVVEVQAAGERAAERDETGVAGCPFRGLAYFDVEDADVFCGRERLVAEAMARVASAPMLGLVGPSGSGKSSVLRAGLLAGLAGGVLPGSESWTRVLMRPGEHPMRDFERTGAAGSGGHLVVAVDQFEELFTTCNEEAERRTFVDALLACTRHPGRRTVLLIAIRADYYGHCAAYPELARLLAANQVLVGPMRRAELRRAIELPAQRAGLHVEPALVEALVGDLGAESGALPLLSSALLEQWQRRDGETLRMGTYERTGGVSGAVARLAERAYSRLEPEGRELARLMFLRLAGEGRGDAVVRERVPLSDFDTARAEVAEVLSVLAAERLVTIGEGEVEVAHEALLREWPRLRGWLEDDAEGRLIHRHLRAAARGWQAGGRDAGELYRGARLVSALEWSAVHGPELNPQERSFLAESRAATERSQRRLRRTLLGVAGLLVLSVVAGLIALDQRNAARDEAVAAEAQRLGARALVENDLDAALLLARQGVALDDTVQTRGNLLATLVRSPAAVGVLQGDGERMWTAALSPDERLLATGDPAGNVVLFDTRTRRRAAAWKASSGNPFIADLAFNTDGSRLAVAYAASRGNVVALVDTRTRRVVSRVVPAGDGFVYGLRYSTDGRALDVIVCAPDAGPGPSVLSRFDTRTGRLDRGPRPVTRSGCSPVMITGDGRRLVAAGAEEATVRDAETLRVLERFPLGGAAGARAHTSAYALGPDDQSLAIGEADGSLRLLDLSTGALRQATGRHGAAVTHMEFSADGRTLVTTSDDADVIVWDAKRAARQETLTGHANGVRSPQVTRDGATLYTAGLDGKVLIWDLTGSRRLGRRFEARVPGDEFAVAQSDDGRLIARGHADGSIVVVDARTLAARGVLPVAPSGDGMRIGFIPRSHTLVVGAREGLLMLVDADTGRTIRRLRGHSGRIYTPGFSRDGRLLVTGSDDDTVRLWSLPDGRPNGAPLRFDRIVFDAQLSPDGRRSTIVLVDPDYENGSVEVWDVPGRRRVRRIRVAGFPGFTRFSRDGRLVAVGNRFGQAQVWSTATWRPVTPWLAGDASGILTASFSSDGSTLATGGHAGTLQLWDIATGQAIGAPLPGAPGQPVVPSFTPDGRRLLANHASGGAFLWDIRSASLLRHACAVAGRRLTRSEWRNFLPERDYRPAC